VPSPLLQVEKAHFTRSLVPHRGYTMGKVGIGTTNPQAMLDINGYAKLAVQTAAPATCASANKGAFAMTTHNGLCFCNGSAWNKVESPATACTW